MAGNDMRSKYSRKDAYMVPPEDLVIVTEITHRLYDERIHLPLDKHMVANVKEFGVKEPVIACKEDGKLLLCDGRQRTRWALAANEELKKEGQVTLLIPVIMEAGDEDEQVATMILANEVRRDDDQLTKAKKAQRLIARGRTEAEAAVIFGVSRAALRNWLKLLGTAPEVQAALEKGEIKQTAANALAELPKEEQAAALAEARKAKEAPSEPTKEGEEPKKGGKGKKKGVTISARDAVKAAAKKGGAKAPKAQDAAEAAVAPSRGALRRALKKAGALETYFDNIAACILSWALGKTEGLGEAVAGLKEKDREGFEALVKASKKAEKKEKKIAITKKGE